MKYAYNLSRYWDSRWPWSDQFLSDEKLSQAEFCGCVVSATVNALKYAIAHPDECGKSFRHLTFEGLFPRIIKELEEQGFEHLIYEAELKTQCDVKPHFVANVSPRSTDEEEWYRRLANSVSKELEDNARGLEVRLFPPIIRGRGVVR